MGLSADARQRFNSVVVVDNDPAVCTFMQTLLENEGLKVVTAEDGLQVLSILEDMTPDLMFIDLVMPNISGEKLCQILRSQRRFDNVYLIVLSAISSEQIIDYVSQGFDACIAKGPLQKIGEIVLSVIEDLGTGITREHPGGVFGLENLYKREITKELLSTKRHFERIFENLTESIIETNRDGRIVFVNPAVTKLFEIPEEDILSRQVLGLFEPGQAAHVQEQIEQVLSGNRGEAVRIEHLGKTITVHVLTVDDDGVISLVLMLEDISELRRAYDELETRVEERTAELAKANTTLKAEIENRKILENRMRSSLREKEVLLNEIHHRVKNNLQVISSLLGLSANRAENVEFKTLIQDMKRRIQSLSLVHDRLYRSDNLANVNAADYLRTLAESLVRSLMDDEKPVDLEIDAFEVILPIDVAVPCALIANELITNSLKHAFVDQDIRIIRIVIRRTAEQRIQFEISDNGVGLPEMRDLEESSTLGLRIVKVLARQMGAQLRIGRKHGTAFRLLIPIQNGGVT